MLPSCHVYFFWHMFSFDWRQECALLTLWKNENSLVNFHPYNMNVHHLIAHLHRICCTKLLAKFASNLTGWPFTQCYYCCLFNTYSSLGTLSMPGKWNKYHYNAHEIYLGNQEKLTTGSQLVHHAESETGDSLENTIEKQNNTQLFLVLITTVQASGEFIFWRNKS